MVDVRVGRASLLERIYPGIHEGAELVPERVINPQGVSDRQRRRSSLNDMSRSQLVAIAVALEHLGENVEVTPKGAEVMLVIPDSPADGVLEVGDVIVEVNGEKVSTTDELLGAFAERRPGRERRARPCNAKASPSPSSRSGPGRSPDDPERAVMGVQVENADDFEFPVDIQIDAGGIGGPSAGLAFALDIIDELGEDIDRGRTIVATGELALDGTVHPIGGVKQKAIGAREQAPTSSSCPTATSRRRETPSTASRVVPVSTFDEALSALATS